MTSCFFALPFFSEKKKRNGKNKVVVISNASAPCTPNQSPLVANFFGVE